MSTLTEGNAIGDLIKRLDRDHKDMLVDREANPEQYDEWEKGFMCGLKDALELAKMYKERYGS